jgi:hypothetical protein
MCGTSRLRSLKDVATMANVETKSGPKVENLAVVVRLPGNLAGTRARLKLASPVGNLG